MTGLSRQQAAEAVAALFGATAIHSHSSRTYDPWEVTDNEGKTWRFVFDASIRATHRSGRRQLSTGDDTYKVEMNFPKLEYSEMGKLQEVVRALRHAGAVVNSSCGMHVHVDASKHTPQSLKNALSIMYSKEDILFKALNVDERRVERWCQKVREPMLERIRKLPTNTTMERLKREWYILRNEKYMGDVLLQKTYTVDFLTKKKKKNNGELTQYYITDNHPAIIPREDFLNAQLELARRNSKRKVSQKKTKSVLGKYCSKYALSERLVCGECGSMYRRTTWSKKGKKKVVWRCISRLEFGTKYCQHSPTLSEEALHQAILQCVQTVAGDKDDIMQNLRDVQENIILFSGSQVTPQSLEKRINKLEQEMSALVKIVAQGGDSDFYAAKLRQLSEQKMDLTSQLQEIQKKKIENQALEYQYQQALIYINNEENMNLTEFNDDFIRRIIEQVTVLSASQIRIRFVGEYELDATLPLQK